MHLRRGEMTRHRVEQCRRLLRLRAGAELPGLVEGRVDAWDHDLRAQRDPAELDDDPAQLLDTLQQLAGDRAG